MTVTNQTDRTSATGSATAGQVVPFSFPISDTSDIIVKTRVTSTGAETTLTETTDYVVTINDTEGGSIELVSALAATSTVHIVRDTPATQALDLEAGDDWNASSVENALDKLARRAVDNEVRISRCLHAPETDATTIDMELPSSVDRTSTATDVKYLAFDTSGNPTVVSSITTSTTPITDFAKTVLAATTAAATRTVLGSTTVGDAVFVAASAAIARTALGVTIGTNVQAWDTDLDAIAALVKGSYYVMLCNEGGTAWTAATPAAFRLALSLPTCDSILVYENAVLTWENNVVNWVT